MERILDDLKDEMRELGEKKKKKKGNVKNKGQKMMKKEMNKRGEMENMEVYPVVTREQTNQHQRNKAGP